jgi:hypothetical protein
MRTSLPSVDRRGGLPRGALAGGARATLDQRLVRISFLMALATFVACSAREVASPVSSSEVVAPSAVVPGQPTPTVTAVLVGSPHVLYSPSILGTSRPSVRVTVSNPAGTPVDISNLRVRLEAFREGTRIDCERTPSTRAAREPAQLGPGVKATFLRSVDCGLPLAGSYRANVIVAFGNVEPWASGKIVREIELTVAAPNGEPRAIEAVSGLYAAIGASTLLSPPAEHGRLVLGLVNAGSEPVVPPPMSVRLRVYRVGTPIPCEDEPIALALPAVLGPGTRHYVPVVVSCLGLGIEGVYDVEAVLLVRGGEQVVGRLRLGITHDPVRVRGAATVP